MPFITENERVRLLQGKLPETPGQLCYMEYIKLIVAWEKEPRWTTIDRLFQETFQCSPEQSSRILAYLVFFALKAIPYELTKEKENGTI